jgi:hypothetical protein
MKDLIRRVKDGIGKGVAVGLLGLTLGLSVPAVAHADGNDLQKLDKLSKALIKIGHEIEDEQNDQQYQDSLNQQKEIQKEQKQYQDNQLELQREELQRQKDQEYQAQLPQNQRHYFACNSLTGNTWTYPRDYTGIKSVFRDNEQLILVDYDPSNKAGDVEKIDVYGPKGNLIFENIGTIPRDATPRETGSRDGSNATTKYFVEKGGYGDFRAVFSLNDEVVGETDFTITQ